MSTVEKSKPSIAQYLWSVFAIDVRSLAALRIAIAIILLSNLLINFDSITAFYSESGVLPLQLSQKVVGQSGNGIWSVTWLSDSTNWIWLCMCVNVVAAIALLLGYQTVPATAICLIMVWSLQVRNPLVLTAGDVLLRMMLFWGLFLPWSKVWSLDCRQDVEIESTRWQVSTIATAAIMLQLAYVYFFSGIAKLSGGWSGSAIVQSLHLEMYVNGLGSWLGTNTWILNWSSPLVLIIEIAGPILLFVPKVQQFWRGMMMALMCLMHIAIWLTMSIGIFSIVAIVSWVIFVPSDVWNGLLGRPNGFDDETNDEVSRLQQSVQYVCGAFLVFVLSLNIANISQTTNSWFPSAFRSLANFCMIQQEFKMFANPPTSSPWPQYVSTLKSYEVVELFSWSEPFSEKKPESVYQYMQSQYWRRYHFNLIHHPIESEVPENYRQLRKQLLLYHVKRWNENHSPDRHVRKTSFYMNFDQLGDDGQLSNETTRQLWAEFDR